MTDLLNMMKKAQEQAEAIQQKMQSLQDELEAIEVEGSSGGGLVRVRSTAKGQVKAVHLDPSVVSEDIEILEDLIVAAVNDARHRSESVMQERMAEMTQGLNLPAGIKFPF